MVIAYFQFLWHDMAHSLVIPLDRMTVCRRFTSQTPVGTHFYYPMRIVFDPYRGIYGAGYILFVYNIASVPWITCVNDFGFFTNISNYVTYKYVLYTIRKVIVQ